MSIPIADFKIVSGSDPAAGAESTITVPAGEVWELIGFEVTLVTDATVANRRPRIVLDDGTTEFFRQAAGADITASLTTIVVGSGASVASLAAGVAHIPLAPGVILGPSYRIRTLTLNLQAGDNYGVPVVFVRTPKVLR